MLKFPEIIIVGGFGQNTGKTTLVSGIISYFSKSNQLLGLKISPHHHSSSIQSNLITDQKGFRIFEEKTPSDRKDSSKMLLSGAIKAYYMEVFDQSILPAWHYFTKYIQQKNLLIVESPSLAHHIEPGILILTTKANLKRPKKELEVLSGRANAVVDIQTIPLENIIQNISIENHAWRWMNN